MPEKICDQLLRSLARASKPPSVELDKADDGLRLFLEHHVPIEGLSSFVQHIRDQMKTRAGFQSDVLQALRQRESDAWERFCRATNVDDGVRCFWDLTVSGPKSVCRDIHELEDRLIDHYHRASGSASEEGEDVSSNEDEDFNVQRGLLIAAAVKHQTALESGDEIFPEEVVEWQRYEYRLAVQKVILNKCMVLEGLPPALYGHTMDQAENRDTLIASVRFLSHAGLLWNSIIAAQFLEIDS